MRFLRTISGLLLAVVTVAPGRAQGDEPPPVRVDLAYASRYVFRGVERAGDSWQATAKFARENLRGRLGTSQPFDRNGTRELNLKAGYAWQPVDGFDLEASVAHAWFNDVPGGGADRSLEAGLTAMWMTAGGFTPRLSYHRDFRFRADTAEIAIARSVALTKLGAFLELNVFAGWVSGADWRPEGAGPRRRDAYGYGGVDAQLPYRIGAYSTLVAGLHYADTFGRSATNGPFGRPTDGNLWATFAVNLDF